MKKSYHIAWWNLENLFDEDGAIRTKELRRKLRKQTKGWTKQILDKKLTNLASVISKMNDGKGPDMLGVCEVENKAVLQKLVKKLSCLNHNYKIAHVDSKDKRGIDVAIIYDKDKFTTDKIFTHLIVKRNPTRDLFQVNFKLKGTTQDLVVIGNHWPSRSGGEEKSEHNRKTAGDNLAYWHQRIIEELGENTPIIAMGDFNDEPSDDSLTKCALASRSIRTVKRAKNQKWYNPMWPLMGNGDGTYYYSGEPLMLDQFLINKALLGNSKLSYVYNSTKVDSDLFAGKIPVRFGSPSRKYNSKGDSDHHSISLELNYNS